MFRKKTYTPIVPLNTYRYDSSQEEMDSISEGDWNFNKKENKLTTYKLIKHGKYKHIENPHKAIKYLHRFLIEKLTSKRFFSRKSQNKLLHFIKSNKIKLTIRLTAKVFHQICVFKKNIILKRIMKSPYIRVTITPCTLKFLWKKSKLSFKKLWKLNLSKKQLEPRNKNHILRGLDYKLFKKIYKSRPILTNQIINNKYTNRDLLIVWAVHLNSAKLVRHLAKFYTNEHYFDIGNKITLPMTSDVYSEFLH
jgi:hypothetical protein